LGSDVVGLPESELRASGADADEFSHVLSRIRQVVQEARLRRM
jgi:hypothetical protein